MIKKNILVIEDERELADSIAEYLSMKNYSVTVCYDGDEALVFLENHRPDIIVCDIAMPNLDGLDVLSALRSDEKFNKIPFIFLTAKTTSDDMRAGMKEGADDYVLKPFRFSDLLDAIETRLQRMNQIKSKDKITNDISPILDNLTKKEREVLIYVCQGLSSKSIAEILFVSDKTIENHRYNITNKLNIEGQGSLLKFALMHKDQII